MIGGGAAACCLSSLPAACTRSGALVVVCLSHMAASITGWICLQAGTPVALWEAGVEGGTVAAGTVQAGVCRAGDLAGLPARGRPGRTRLPVQAPPQGCAALEAQGVALSALPCRTSF